MEKFTIKDHYDYPDLLTLTAFLRAPGGCPWDSVQTHESVRRNFIEEVYEVCEAFDQDDPVHMCEELGDVLYQVLFHADIEREAGRFTMDEVIDGVCKKLVARHPFLFAEEAASSADEALDRWDNVKRSLNGHKTHTQAMDSVSRTLPALWRAEKLHGKAEKAGLHRMDALEQAKEAICAMQAGADGAQALGNALFALSGAAHELQIDPEEALNQASERFIRRFEVAELAANAEGKQTQELAPKRLDALWAEETEGNFR